MVIFGNPSLITRIAIGKAIGLLIGLIGFICLPWFVPDVGLMLRWGVLFWYTTVGAIVGLIIGYFATRFGGEGRATLEAEGSG